jgi:hypothetical protein
MFARFAEAFASPLGPLENRANAPGIGNRLMTVTQTVDDLDLDNNPKKNTYQSPPVPALRPDPKLVEIANTCSKSSIDQLLKLKKPNADLGCGWMYTPPNVGSTLPRVSKGALGTKDGPLPDLSNPQYKQWFFDLQLAKKQMLMDRCRALQSCERVDNNVFKGACGYCPELGIGVPINRQGKPLYPEERLGNCSNVIRSASQCNVKEGFATTPPGNTTILTPPTPLPPATPTTPSCDEECLRNLLTRQAGCKEEGALALALAEPKMTGGLLTNDFINSEAVKLYNLSARPPMNVRTIQSGNATAAFALAEFSRLFNNGNNAPDTRLKAAAQDLCLQKGILEQFNFCSDISDSSPPPFNLKCLQQLLVSMAGTNAEMGRLYPHSETMKKNIYDLQFKNLGLVKNYINGFIRNLTSQDPVKRTEAFLNLRGTPAIRKAPYSQGVEVFWFAPNPKKPNQVGAFLRRTIEKNIVRFPSPGLTTVPQIKTDKFMMMQLTNVIIPPLPLKSLQPPSMDFQIPSASKQPPSLQIPSTSKQPPSLQPPSIDLQNPSESLLLSSPYPVIPRELNIKFSVTSDDGFFISVNQPVNSIKSIMESREVDKKGVFANLTKKGTLYQSNVCTLFRGGMPNITQIYYENSNGGGHTFDLQTLPCPPTITKDSPFMTNQLSITCEREAPFLSFELINDTTGFQELRNPFLFSPLIRQTNVNYNTRTDETVSVPGRKPYVRLNNAQSAIQLTNIAFQSWGTMTIALRMKTISSFEETLVYCQTGSFFFSIVAKKSGEGVVSLLLKHNFNKDKTQTTSFQLLIDQWYLLTIINNNTGFQMSCNSISDIISNKERVSAVSVDANKLLFGLNTSSSITIGTNGLSKQPPSVVASSTACTYDVAWIHFFDYRIQRFEILRDAHADWVYSSFPRAPGVFDFIES